MSRKLNCWEFRDCGRERNGVLADVKGVCPVALALEYDGMNDGQAGGRVCWMIRRCPVTASAFPPGERTSDCHLCTFYRRVAHEEAGRTREPMAAVDD
ncbi:hypothetical protein GF420_04405 [candidate division GN15 bacterium]|nr:hypothetical protein [candidate division GN15 bacterium]